MLFSLLGFGLGIPSGGLAGSADTIDQSLMTIERVDARLELTANLVTQVAQTASADGVTNIADLEPLLQKAAIESFHKAAIQDSIVAVVGRTAAVDVDPAAFVKAAQGFTVAAERLRKADGVQDEAFTAQINARLADQQAGINIAALAQAMASPELAIETALTGQVMYSALDVLTNSTTAELGTLSPDVLQSQLRGVVEQLRSKTSNEKPVPKDVAAAQEKHQLSLILAAIPQEDLAVLNKFYFSKEGKAKRDDLVAAYRQYSSSGNRELLAQYLSVLLAHVKNQPLTQQK